MLWNWNDYSYYAFVLKYILKLTFWNSVFKLNLITCCYDEINILSIAGVEGIKFESYVHTDKEAITPYILKIFYHMSTILEFWGVINTPKMIIYKKRG